MSLSSIFGGQSGPKVRYAIVGLGDISQQAMMPGFEQAENSEITALVTSDPEKAAELAKMYKVSHTYSYEQYDELLRSGEIDAVYIATPNWRHAEFAVPALRAGIHVLLEKPMEISTAKCREILEAQKASGAKLMIAYRLHFEPGTMDTIERIRNGEIGEVRLFNATFSQMVDPENHRAQNGYFAGPLLDMGTYPVNASRYIFEEEPTEVISATGIKYPGTGVGELHDTVSATLRFPGDRIAHFMVSYTLNTIDTFTAVGTRGNIEMNPGFGFGHSLEQFIKIGDKESHHAFKNADQFAGELHYFSECIQKQRDPEPDGEEGYADVRVMEGIQRAIETGRSVKLEPFTRAKRINTDLQEERFRYKKPPSEEVNASSPSRKVS